MGSFGNPDPPPEDVDQNKSITVITTNVVTAITKTSEHAGALRNDNIETTHRNVFATKN